MIMSGPVRIGKNAEIRETPQGTPVAEFPVAYDYGLPDDSGNRPTQWVIASLWGKRAKSLGPHLKSGRLIELALKDLHVEPFETANGTRYKLKGRVLDVEFIPIRNGRQDQRSQGDNRGSGPPQGTRAQQSTPASEGTSNSAPDSAHAGVELEDASPFDVK